MIKQNKTKILQLTDLHLERNVLNDDFGQFNHLLYNKVADIIVLTGDINNGIAAIHLIKALIKAEYKVIYVLGNGEFYHFDIHELIEKWRIIASTLDNFYFLEGNSVIINDIEFFGSCLWTSVGTNSSAELVSKMNIESLSNVHKFNVTKNFNCEKMKNMHFNSIEKLKTLINNSLLKKKVALSHYLPSFKSVDPRYLHSNINNIFASNIDPFFFSEQAGIQFWFHGHTHSKVKYSINNTTIICNPYGRQDDNNLHYDLNEGIIEL